MIIYGLKGLSAYAYHAIHLGVTPKPVSSIANLLSFVADAEDALSSDDEAQKKRAPEVSAVVEQLLFLGRMCHETMQELESANTSTYGNPSPTKVHWGPKEGKCILVSGHDLLDLHSLLKQTEGTGINIYTHGEMIPAHGYPTLRAFPHLAGHYGTAWQNQRKEFAQFPGPILMTTNCIVPPAPEYASRIWCTGPVGFPGLHCITASEPHTPTDFAPLIAQAQSLPGFTGSFTPATAPSMDISVRVAYPPSPLETRSVTVGYGRAALNALVPDVLAAVQAGHLKRVLVIGGCDGFETQRSYYTDLVRMLPADTIVVTVACGKFRFNNLGLDAQTVPNTKIPRLLDAGQCNDCSAVVAFASELAARAQCTPNDLPLSICLSWFEQKAVADLLALLSLGLRNIRLGPRAPLFVTQDALQLLHDTFGLTLCTNAADDLPALLGK